MLDLAWAQGKYMDAQNYKKLYAKAFGFCEILKMREQIFEIGNFFCGFLLYTTRRKCSQIKQQLKVKIEEEGEALWKLSRLYIY